MIKTLGDVFKTFTDRGDKTAMVFRSGVRRFVYSYSEFNTLILQMGTLLGNRGITKGDRVMIWAPNSPWWAVAYWGCAINGVIVVPVDFSSGKERAESIAEVTECKLILQSRYKPDRFDDQRALCVEELHAILADLSPEERLPEIREVKK